jgi:hypothetical protein
MVQDIKGLYSDRIFGRVRFSVWIDCNGPFPGYIHLLDAGCVFYLPYLSGAVIMLSVFFLSLAWISGEKSEAAL